MVENFKILATCSPPLGAPRQIIESQIFFSEYVAKDLSWQTLHFASSS
jgi:hypothetical protein